MITEQSVINDLETVISPNLKGYRIKVLERDFNTLTSYNATIGVLAKEGSITYDLIKKITEMICDRDDDDVRIVGTKTDIKDLDFDVLMVSAKVNLV